MIRTLKQCWIDINVNIHKTSKSDYEKNDDEIILKVNDPIIIITE